MYTLKLENVGVEYTRIAQSLVQEGKPWSYEIEISPSYQNSISLSTFSIREMKRLVDLLESVEFMRND